MTAAQAQAFLKKSEEYLASATDDLVAGRFTAASGNAIHAGISAKDAVVMALTGSVTKHKDHSQATAELKAALGKRPETAAAERAVRELVGAKSEVEYGVDLATESQAKAMLRRAQYLVNLSTTIIRLGSGPR
jgi:hypothetical protein